MKYENRKHKVGRLLIVGVALVALAQLTAARSAGGSVTIVNNSSRSFSHVYFSHANSDDWTGDQLNNASLAAGQSTSVNYVSWDAPQLKVIAEDADGCFSSTVVDGSGNVTWTITNNTPADCGSN